MILARNFSFLWALIACLAYRPYIGAAFIAIGAISHYLLIRAVYRQLGDNE
jgi:energy-converting hydrogenase Eha subunit E